MKISKIIESKGDTFYIKGKGIPKGCKLCLDGSKVVLFLNGKCQKPPHCSWYCPISEERKGEEIAFADEIEIISKEGLLEEVNKIKAKGMSITGGDPLLVNNIEKTIEFIKYIKKEKGSKFHVHLYTNGIDLTEDLSKRLALAGLDEIRFHPPRDKWEKVKLALDKGMSVGAEVPVIPTVEYIKKLKAFILFLDKIGAEFINLNEFEMCEPNSKFLMDRGFKLVNGTIASVEKSKEMALEMIHQISQKVSLKIHFCTIRSKDHNQLKKRYLRRAKSIKKPYEVITEEGLLLYALLEGKTIDMEKFNSVLIYDAKIPKKLLLREGNNLKLPIHIALDEQFIVLLDKFNLKGFIIEQIPFRGKYCQITEKTPLKVFKQDYED